MSTAEMASGYVRRMVEREAKGWGDQNNALTRIEQRYGLPFWSMDRLRTGRAKTVEAGLFQRIRMAYLDMCQRQVVALEHEIAMERAVNGDDDVASLEAEIEALARKVAAKKARRGRQ